MLISLVTLALALVVTPQATVTGKWDGTLTGQRPDGTAASEPVLLILEQKDNGVTGSVGKDESDRHPITSGTIDGNKVVLQAKNARNDREYRLELTLENDELKGTVTSGSQTAQVQAKRRKE